MNKNGFAKYQSAPGFAPILILIIIAILGVGFYLYEQYEEVFLPLPQFSTTVASPSPVGTIVQNLKQSISGMYFRNDCMSGEWGIFKSDGSIKTTFGRDFVPNDTRSNTAVGTWTVLNNKIIVKGSAITDGEYSITRVVEQSDGSSIYDLRPANFCGVTIGKLDNVIEKYQKK